MSNEIRLQKFMSDCGVCSRRKAEEYIEQGKVKIGARTASLGDKIDPAAEAVYFDGKKVEPRTAGYAYYMLNKPRGYVSTLSDEQGRRCIADLIADIPRRVVPIGRLDRNSEGLLLLTDDGGLVNKLTHPSHEVSKYYLVTINGKVSDESVEKLNSPLEIDGYVTSSSVVTVLKREPGRAVLRFELKEGRNRQIRKMCEKVELEVARLKRYQVGKIKLREVKAGAWRELDANEISYLKSL